MNNLMEHTINNYFMDRNTPELSLADRFQQIERVTYGRFGMNKLVTIYSKLLNERHEIREQLVQAEAAKNELVGTGEGGIAAQMHWEMLWKKARTYTDGQFDNLKVSIGRVLYDKHSTLSAKASYGKKLDPTSLRFCQLGRQIYSTVLSLDTPEKLLEYLKLANEQVGNLILPLNSLIKYMQGR